MIIRMKQGASLLMAEANAKVLAQAGFNVQVRNGDGNFTLATLGLGNQFLLREKLIQMESIVDDNSLFNNEHESFKEAWEFFRAK